MDKLLLDALNNLSLSLENLTLALQQKSDAKSDVAGALSSGDISKKLDQILASIKSDTVKSIPNRPEPSILSITKSIQNEKNPTFIKKPETPSVKPPVFSNIRPDDVVTSRKPRIDALPAISSSEENKSSFVKNLIEKMSSFLKAQSVIKTSTGINQTSTEDKKILSEINKKISSTKSSEQVIKSTVGITSPDERKPNFIKEFIQKVSSVLKSEQVIKPSPAISLTETKSNFFKDFFQKFNSTKKSEEVIKTTTGLSSPEERRPNFIKDFIQKFSSKKSEDVAKLQTSIVSSEEKRSNLLKDFFQKMTSKKSEEILKTSTGITSPNESRSGFFKELIQKFISNFNKSLEVVKSVTGITNVQKIDSSIGKSKEIIKNSTGISNSENNKSSIKEFSQKINSNKSEDVIKMQTSIVSSEEKKSNIFKDLIQKIFSSFKKSEEVIKAPTGITSPDEKKSSVFNQFIEKITRFKRSEEVIKAPTGITSSDEKKPGMVKELIQKISSSFKKSEEVIKAPTGITSSDEKKPGMVKELIEKITRFKRSEEVIKAPTGITSSDEKKSSVLNQFIEKITRFKKSEEVIKAPTGITSSEEKKPGFIKELIQKLSLKSDKSKEVIQTSTGVASPEEKKPGFIKELIQKLSLKSDKSKEVIQTSTGVASPEEKKPGFIKELIQKLSFKSDKSKEVVSAKSTLDSNRESRSSFFSDILKKFQSKKDEKVESGIVNQSDLSSTFKVGSSFNSIPVVPVAIASLPGGASLVSSPSVSRVIGVRMAKDGGDGGASGKSGRDGFFRGKSNVPPGGDFGGPGGPSGPGGPPKTPGSAGLSMGDGRPVPVKIVSPLPVPVVIKSAKDMARPSTEKVAKDEKSKPVFDDESKKRVKDGVTLLVLMAAGILAIGLAFKVIGSVDFKSVLALAIALPLVAIAFEKISKVKVTPKEMAMISLSLLVMAATILAASYILSKIATIGMAQAFTAIIIAGTFAIISTKMGNIIESLSKVNPLRAIVAALLMPLLFVSISYAIMKSSVFIANTKPVGLANAFSAIVIAGTFAIISLSLGKLIGSFKNIDPMGAVLAAAIMPIVLIGVSYAIMKSSDFIRNVKPIGLQQAFSTIVIAGAFALLGFGIGKLLTAFDKVNPVQAVIFALVAPIILIASSYAIMVSSRFISQTKPVGLLNAISAIFISAVFVVLSFGIKKMVHGLKDVSVADAIKAGLLMPVIFVPLSIAIMYSSPFISQTKPVGLLNFFAAIMISVIFVAMSFAVKTIIKNLKDIKFTDIKQSFLILLGMSVLTGAVGLLIGLLPPLPIGKVLGFLTVVGILLAMTFSLKIILNNTKNIQAQDMIKSGIVLTAFSVVVFMTSIFISKLPPISNQQLFNFLKISGGLLLIGIVALGLTKITNRINKSDLLKAALVIVTLAATIMISSRLLALGKYENLPKPSWVLGAVASIGLFGLLSFGMSKLGLSNIIKGGIAILAVALVIMIASRILNVGNYGKYPGFKWSLGVALGLGLFGVGAVLLGTQALNPFFYAGLGVILLVAGTIVAASYILNAGEYNKYPSLGWALGVGLSLSGFGVGAVLLGTQVLNPFFYAGLGVILTVAGTILATSIILGVGKYDKYPPMSWVLPTILVVGAFGLSAAALGLISPFIAMGVVSILLLAGSIYLIDKIFTKGSFDKYPPEDWVNQSILIMGKFSLLAISMALVLPLILLGGISMLALAGLIWLVDRVFSKGEYKRYPSDKWISSVHSVLLRFSNLLRTIRKELGFGDLLMGSIKVLGTVLTINEIDKAFSRGNYVKYPSKDWNDGVTYTMKNLMSLMKDKSFWSVVGERIGSFFGGGLDDMAGIIVKIANKLNKGVYSKVPTAAWNKGVSESFGVFMKLMKDNSFWNAIGDKIGSFFGGGLGGLAEGIVNVDKILSKGKYSVYPGAEWTKNVIGVLTSFKSLSSSGGVVSAVKGAAAGFVNLVGGAFKSIGSAITGASSTKVSSGSTASLNEVADQIKQVSIKLASGNYTKFPSQQWMKSILVSVSSMSAVTRLASGVSSTQISTMKYLTSSIVQMDSIFSKSKFTNFPKTTWVKGVSTSILSFVDLMKRISSSAMSVIIGGKILNSIISSILKIDQEIAKGKFNKFPDSKWISSVSAIVSNYSKILVSLNKSISLSSLKMGTIKLNSIISSITSASNLLSLGNYQKMPSMKWLDSFSKVSTMFGTLAIKFDKQFNIISLLTGLNKIRKISETIRDISNSLNRGNYNKFPPLEWAKGVVSSLSGFLNLKVSVSGILSIITGKGGEPDMKKLKSVIDNILLVDKSFSKGSFKNFPSDAWSGGIIKTLGRFSTIMRMIDLTSIGSKMSGSVNFKSITSNLEVLARSFDKLGESVQKFSESINVIDDKKLNSIRTLTSNVVLLSLMDSTQFDKMMQKLEQNSDIFNKLLSDTKPNSGTGKMVGVKSSTVQLSDVKTPGKSGPIEMRKPDENMQVMQNLVAVLTDIASVVGSRGKLKEYLEEKESVTTQAFKWFGG